MGLINILDDNTINKIAAGEVIERPSSIVKELVENSIDAGATEITIEISGGGISSIRIIDNGKGIVEEDLETAFLRHATSKIHTEIDLYTISTLGFRGEALASIAAVSKVELTSRVNSDKTGHRIRIEGGKFLLKEECGCPEGTIISINDVFFNTPARLKFLKSEAKETMNITNVIENLALSNPNISFKYRVNSKNILSTLGDNDLKSVILAVYGKEVIKNIIELNSSKDFITVRGYVGNSNISKGSRNQQSIFVNGRYVKNKTITAAVEAAFKSMLMINKFPFFVTVVTVNPEFIDVNVHPTKAEVKFQDEQMIFKAVYAAVKDVLVAISDLTNDPIDTPAFTANVPPVEYAQEKLNLQIESTLNKRTEPVNTNVEYIYETVSRDPLPDNTPKLQNTKDYFEAKYVPIMKKETVPESTSIPKFEPLVPLGQLHFTYIVAEGAEEMYLIDQHAAHERVYYEKYLNQYNNASIQSQTTLVPIVIELSPSQKLSILDNLMLFTKLGYEIEDFGGNSVALRAVPVIYGSPDPTELFEEIIGDNDVSTKEVLRTIDKVFYTMACKSAIKAGDKISLVEMSELIDQLRHCDSPFNCPHGRPTIIKMSYYELEKKFKRIQ